MTVCDGQLSGEFSGFEHLDTIFEFLNGKKRRQETYYYHYHAAFLPTAKVVRERSRYVLHVSEVQPTVEVTSVWSFAVHGLCLSGIAAADCAVFRARRSCGGCTPALHHLSSTRNAQGPLIHRPGACSGMRPTYRTWGVAGNHNSRQSCRDFSSQNWRNYVHWMSAPRVGRRGKQMQSV